MNRLSAITALMGGALVMSACTAVTYRGSESVKGGAPWEALPRTEAALVGPGVISTEAEEYRITFSPEGRTAYFARSEEFFRRSRIYETQLVNGQWTDPQIAPFSGQYSDNDPVISPDGSRLYFSSIRPVDGAERSDSDIWVVERVNDGWGPPQNLGPIVNTPYSESYPSVDAAGNLYVGSSRPHAEGKNRKYNIWMFAASDVGFREGLLLNSGINSADSVWNFNPSVSPDGEMLVFTRLDLRDQPGTGFGELFVALKAGNGWTEGRNVGMPVNTRLDEFHASFSPDGGILYFVRRNPNDSAPNGDLFSLRVDDLVEPLR